MSVKIIRSRSLSDVFLKSQVTISEDKCKMSQNYSRQFICKVSRRRDIPFDLAVLSDFYLKETTEAPNKKFTIRIDLVLYDITTDGVETVLLKVEDKAEAQRLLSEDLLSMFDNKIQTDVVLNIQGEEIHAHKSILCARSTIFAKMFQQKMTESMDEVVFVADIKMSIMKKLVDYMYSKVNYNYDFEEAMDLYYAADKYGLLKLREKCGEIIRLKVTKDNVVHGLLLADRNGDKKLKETMMDIINSNFKTCVKADWWDDFVRNNLELYKEVIDALY